MFGVHVDVDAEGARWMVLFMMERVVLRCLYR
jgi:hypothetical protein